MKNDLTLKKIKNTNFEVLYNDFIIRKPFNKKQYEKMLSIAICFLNAKNTFVKQLGYRIIVEYCNQTSDYVPLYEIAINNGLYPISKFIENNYISSNRKNFFTEWNDAFTEQYKEDEIYQSEQQKKLKIFFESKVKNTVSIIAPTSYGKSELIVSAVQDFSGKKICIITSTKALLMQTKKRIKNVAKSNFSKIILHPEMYNSADNSCLAVLTQERLLRLLKKDKNLAFDCIIVDEAHEILEDEERQKTLATVIIVAQKRNPEVVFKFLTPFISDKNNLKTRYASYDVTAFEVDEYVKTERYFVYDTRNQSGLKLYDQFFNSFISVPGVIANMTEERFVMKYCAEKNLVYMNKPTDVENFALLLANILPAVQSEKICEACNYIAEYLMPQYNLITCLKKGIIYHHGSVPDSVRLYIEDLYKKEPSIKFVVTNSTLLSGVNLPAERMFILDNKKGRSNLRPEAFKNLVGRVCRFSDIFRETTGSLQRLEPEIYIVFGRYFSKSANYSTFLSKVAKVDIELKDEVENVLLENTTITSDNQNGLQQASEFVENYENGIIKNYQYRYTTTEIGKCCIMNGINEMDIFNNETQMQNTIDKYRNNGLIIMDANQLLSVVWEVFLKYVPDSVENLKRFEHDETKKFYAMLLHWRESNKSYSEMIGLFTGYWRQKLKNYSNAAIYVGKWGDLALHNSRNKHYTYLKGKTKSELINLAIVRIKEEQDFIDNVLMKFVEALFDMGILDNVFYNKIKYGTDDEYAICLLKNGFSFNLTMLLLNKYKSYMRIDVNKSTVVFSDSIIIDMIGNKENYIYIYELNNYM